MRERARVAGLVGLGASLLLSGALFVAAAPDTRPLGNRLARGLGAVVDPTEDALRAGVGAADGADGRYVVTWSDALHIGSAGYGLVNELERRGLDANGMPGSAVPLTSHRTIEPREATAMVHLATGAFIERARLHERAVEVAYVDPRTNAERAEFDALRDQVESDLVADGLEHLLPRVDDNLFGAALHPDLGPGTRRALGRMLDLGQAVAVFITPPETLFR